MKKREIIDKSILQSGKIMRAGRIKFAMNFIGKDGSILNQEYDEEFSDEIVKSIFGDYKWSIDGENWRDPNPEQESATESVFGIIYYKYPLIDK